jgi:hypothetical protein
MRFFVLQALLMYVCMYLCIQNLRGVVYFQNQISSKSDCYPAHNDSVICSFKTFHNHTEILIF